MLRLPFPMYEEAGRISAQDKGDGFRKKIPLSKVVFVPLTKPNDTTCGLRVLGLLLAARASAAFCFANSAAWNAGDTIEKICQSSAS